MRAPARHETGETQRTQNLEASTTDAATATPSKRRVPFKTIARWAISISILVFVVWHVGPSKFLEYLSAQNSFFLLGAFLIAMLDLFIRAWNWQRLIKSTGINADLRKLTYASLTGGFWGFVVPSSFGTDAARATMAAQVVPMPMTSALATVISLNAVGLFASSFVGIAGAIWLYLLEYQRHLAAVAGALFVAQIGAALVVLWLLGHARRWLMSSDWTGGPLSRRIHRTLAKLGAAFMPFGDSRESRRDILAVALLSQAMRPVGLWLACEAVGAELPFAALVMWAPLGALVNLLPISVAGFGGKQAVYMYYFALFGVPAGVGFTAAILDQAAQLGVALSGGLAFAFSGTSLRRAPDAGAEDGPRAV